SRTDGTGGHPQSRVIVSNRSRGHEGTVFKEESQTMLRSRNLLTSLVLLAGLGLPLLATPAARAGLIPNKITVTPDGENFRWTYNVVVTSDLYVSKGDFFTIYDFAGADPSTITQPATWTRP